MKKNMGAIDTYIRVGIAIVVAVLMATKVITGTVAIVAGVLAIIFVLTSLIRFCPLYLPFGISTAKKTEDS